MLKTIVLAALLVVREKHYRRHTQDLLEAVTVHMDQN